MSNWNDYIDLTDENEMFYFKIVNDFKGHDDCKVYSVVCNSDLNPFVLKVINLTNMCIDKVQNYCNICLIVKFPNIVSIIPYISQKRDLLLLQMPLFPDSLYYKDPITFFKSHNIFNCMIDICDALIQLHSINVIHGNIKPSNILITNDDNYVLTDYCKNQLYDLSNYLPVITTYRYTPPEVLQSKEYNLKSDMWSYGCLLHFLFSGKNAFDKLDFSSLKSDIINTNFTSKVLYYTEYVNVLLSHLINVNPENRISSLELRNALDIFKEEISKPVVINAKYIFDQCFDKESTKRKNDKLDLRKNIIKKEKTA